MLKTLLLIVIGTGGVKNCLYGVNIYKKGRRVDLGSERSASLTLLVVKVLEEILKSRIEKHFVDNMIL